MKKFLKDSSGVTAVEYGLIAGAMGLMLALASPPIAAKIGLVFTKIGIKLGS